MGRKSFKKKFNKSSLSRSIKRPKNLYVINISFNDIYTILDSSAPDSGLILKNMVIAGIALMIMAQITISVRPEGAEYVDKLPSYKDLKKKFISGSPGRTLAAAAGFAAAFPWLMQDPQMQGDDGANKIIILVTNMVDMPSPNTRRITPSISDWQLYAKGEAGAAMGQMLSCPATNFKTINIEPNVGSYGLNEAFECIGISKENLSKFNITPESIAREVKEIFLIESSGMPTTKLVYAEPIIISSQIQREIMGESLVRSGVANSVLSKGLEPDSSITKALVEKYLNPRELIAYRFAINTGDRNILKKYTDIVKSRSKTDVHQVNQDSTTAAPEPSIENSATNVYFKDTGTVSLDSVVSKSPRGSIKGKTC